MLRRKPPLSPEDRCGGCAWFRPDFPRSHMATDEQAHGPFVGECHFHAPTPDGGFALVEASEFCGDFTPAEIRAAQGGADDGPIRLDGGMPV